MMEFMEKSGFSFSRSNGLRPLPKSTNYFLWLSVASCLSLAVIIVVGSSLRTEDVIGSYGWLIIGALFLLVSVLGTIRIIADCIRRTTLPRLSRAELKARLKRECRSHRFVVKRQHLRSAILGAFFFGGGAAVSVLRWFNNN